MFKSYGMPHINARKVTLTLNHYTLQVHSAPLRKCIILVLLGILCYQSGEAFEGNDFGEDQIAMESAPSFSSYPQPISILPAPADIASKYKPSGDNSEDLPSAAALKSPSELRRSTSRTFKVCIALDRLNESLKVMS